MDTNGQESRGRTQSLQKGKLTKIMQILSENDILCSVYMEKNGVGCVERLNDLVFLVKFMNICLYLFSTLLFTFCVEEI